MDGFEMVMVYKVPAESEVEIPVKSEYELFPEALLIVFKETFVM